MENINKARLSQHKATKRQFWRQPNQTMQLSGSCFPASTTKECRPPSGWDWLTQSEQVLKTLKATEERENQQDASVGPSGGEVLSMGGREVAEKVVEEGSV